MISNQPLIPAELFIKELFDQMSHKPITFNLRNYTDAKYLSSLAQHLNMTAVEAQQKLDDFDVELTRMNKLAQSIIARKQ